METSRLNRVVPLAALSGFIFVASCLTYEPGFQDPVPEGNAAVTNGATSGAGAADGTGGTAGAANTGGTGSGFVPAIACGAAGLAKLQVVDKNFKIQCGCAEASGKTCTIAAHTEVVWTFIDSEEHNVTAQFGDSPDKLAGTFKRTFDEPGQYPYNCSVHASMNGYTIIVIEP